MAQSGYTPILIYASGTATNVPLAADMTSTSTGAELAINYADGKLYYKNSSNVVTLLASSSGASGDVVGPASATDNALVRFDLTTGKLIQNSVGILSDAGILTGLTGLTSSGSITFSSLTSGRVTYAGASGLLSDSANFVFDGTNVGIGTNSPTAKLDITSASAGFSNIKLVQTGVRTWAIENTGTSGLFKIIEAGVSDRLVIDSSGNVGIGTSSPAQALEISSTNSGSFSWQRTGVSAKKWTITSDNSGTYFNNNTDSINNVLALANGGNVGIGTSSPAYTLDVVGRARMGIAGSTPALTLVSGTNGSADVFVSNNTSGLRLVGGTVIGTDAGILIGGSASGTSTNIYFDGAVKNFRDTTGNTTQMVLDTSGNLGLGVTPNWGSAVLFPAFQVGVASAFMSGQGSTEGFYAGSNAYYNAGWNYKVNGYATHIRQQNGAHAWFTAPSGTAGNAITFTQAMTLDASGNLGVGVTSIPASSRRTLQISNGTSGGILLLNNNASEDQNPRIFGTVTNATDLGLAAGGSTGFINYYTNGTERMRIDSSGSVQIRGDSTDATFTSAGQLAIKRSSSDPVLSFHANAGSQIGFIQMQASGDCTLGITVNQALLFKTNNTERMRITSGGNVGIGTTTPTSGSGADRFLVIQGTASAAVPALILAPNLGNTHEISSYNGLFRIFNSSTAQMTLDNSGNLLVGKTASGQVLTPGFEYNNTSNQQYLSICNNTAGNTALYVANNATSGTRQFVLFYGGSSAVGSIDYNGTLTSYNTTSDERLKENVVDSGSGLDKLANIKIRAFDWKANGMHTDFGVIAQELQQVSPESVSAGEDNEDGSIKRPWAVDTSALVPAMIKAIQELKAEVDSLKQQLASK